MDPPGCLGLQHHGALENLVSPVTVVSKKSGYERAGQILYSHASLLFTT
jgi:hypothetical protein